LKIYLDQREDPRVEAILRSWVEVERRRLPLGDMATDHCIVERKSYSDYVASLVDGRLFDQAARMTESEKVCFIVIHNDFKEPPVQRQVTDAQIYGSMAALVVENAIPVVFIPNIYNALYCAYKILEKVEQGKYLKPRHLRKPSHSKAPWIVRKVAQLFDIPYKTAAQLLLKYGSIENIMKADDLTSVPGIGTLRAHRIKTILCKDYRKSSSSSSSSRR